MIEELEYGEGDDESDESSSEEDAASDSEGQEEEDKEMEDNQNSLFEDQEDESDDGSIMADGQDQAALMELMDEPEDDEVEGLESVPVQNDDDVVDAFNVIEVEENENEGSNLIPGDRLLDLQQIEGILDTNIAYRI